MNKNSISTFNPFNFSFFGLNIYLHSLNSTMANSKYLNNMEEINLFLV